MRLRVEAWIAIAAATLALVFGGLWLHSRDQRLRAEGRLVEARIEMDLARAQSARMVAASNERAREADERAREADERAREADERIAEASRERDAARRNLAEAIQRAPGAADRIVVVAATGDTSAVREAVNALSEVHAEERRAWAEIVRTDSVEIAELRAVNVRLRAAVDGYQNLDASRISAMSALEARAEAAERALGLALEATPGWWEKTGWKLAVPVAIAATVYGCHKLGC